MSRAQRTYILGKGGSNAARQPAWEIENRIAADLLICGFPGFSASAEANTVSMTCPEKRKIEYIRHKVKLKRSAILKRKALSDDSDNHHGSKITRTATMEPMCGNNHSKSQILAFTYGCQV